MLKTLSILMLLATVNVSCAIWPATKSCAEIIASDTGTEAMPLLKRWLANPSYENAAAEIAGLVAKEGLAFVRCMVEQIKSDSAGTFSADPDSATRVTNASRWLEENK